MICLKCRQNQISENVQVLSVATIKHCTCLNCGNSFILMEKLENAISGANQND